MYIMYVCSLYIYASLCPYYDSFPLYSGKTIQTAMFLELLNKCQGVRGPFLIVAPLSTVINWVRELSTWTHLDVVLYHGNQDDRDIIREHEFFYMSRSRTDGYKIQVIVTSPETCLARDAPNGPRELSNIYFEMMVVDEAHKLKNYDSRLSVTLREEFTYRHCLLLTGTPLQVRLN